MMRYIQEISINSFRGIRNLKLFDLGAINIIVGKNNSGKTSVLEAINIIENPFELGAIISIGKKREIINNQNTAFTIFKNLLNKFTNSIDIEGIIQNKEFKLNITGKDISLVSEQSISPIIKGFEGKIEIKFGELPETKDIRIMQNENNFVISNNESILPITYITSIDHVIENNPNELIKKGKKKELINLLSLFDDKITGLEMIEENTKAIPYIEYKQLGLLPLSVFGDGLKKILLICSAVINAENGVLLIDEVETAIHISALINVFDWFVKACVKYNVQVFMTTNSLEVIDNILEGQNKLNNITFLEESVRIITLVNDLEKQKTKVRNISGLKAYNFREDFNVELR